LQYYHKASVHLIFSLTSSLAALQKQAVKMK
jgi:hypothetical protein